MRYAIGPQLAACAVFAPQTTIASSHRWLCDPDCSAAAARSQPSAHSVRSTRVNQFVATETTPSCRRYRPLQSAPTRPATRLADLVNSSADASYETPRNAERNTSAPRHHTLTAVLEFSLRSSTNHMNGFPYPDSWPTDNCQSAPNRSFTAPSSLSRA